MDLIKELNRKIKNLIGQLAGYEKCKFCGDRGNWKPWMADISLNTYPDGRNLYKPPVCTECFKSQRIEAVLHTVNADISEYNNFCRCFTGALYYSDAEQEQVMSRITQAKNNIYIGRTLNSN